jgi:hypothetical protein
MQAHKDVLEIARLFESAPLVIGSIYFLGANVQSHMLIEFER